MRHITRFVGIPIVLFVIFLLAGSIGLLCESIHNDLAVSTTAFLGAFASSAGIAWHFYHSIF